MTDVLILLIGGNPLSNYGIEILRTVGQRELL